jgi:hypothetical protein
MIRFTQIVFLALLSISVALPTAEAQKKGKTGEIKEPVTKLSGNTPTNAKPPAPAKKVKSSKESVEKWTRTGLKTYKFSFAYPEDWAVNQTEHPDPDELLPAEGTPLDATDFNGIEVNREGFESGQPYILVYAVKKHQQTFDEFYTHLLNDIGFSGAEIVGADSTARFGDYPVYDVTYKIPTLGASVRYMVIYANGYRYGLQYTALEDKTGNAFRKHMPRFERLLETLEIEN